MAEEITDADLLVRARRRDRDAVAELYARHRPAARRLAATYPRAGDPDDLVNEAFFRVLGAIERGSGPDSAFRAYLFVTLRRAAMETIARTRDEPVDEVPEPVMDAERQPPLDPADRQLILAAYASLPARQQSVLWQTEVEGRRPRELAPVLGLSANAVSASASRARDRLRQAYLQAHVATTSGPECEPHRARLGAYVRDDLAPQDRADTQSHLDTCRPCRDLVGELADVNTRLVRCLVPLFVGASKGGVLAGGAVGGAWRAATRIASKGRSNPGLVAAASVVVCGMVAAVASGLLGTAEPDGSGSGPSSPAVRPALVVDVPSEPPRSEPTSASRPAAPTTTAPPADAPAPAPRGDAPASPTTAPSATASPAPTPPVEAPAPPATTPPPAPQPPPSVPPDAPPTTTRAPQPSPAGHGPPLVVVPPPCHDAHPSPPIGAPVCQRPGEHPGLRVSVEVRRVQG